MLCLHQRDGLCQRSSVTPNEARVEFIQQRLLGAAQVLDVLVQGCAHSPPLFAYMIGRSLGVIKARVGGDNVTEERGM